MMKEDRRIETVNKKNTTAVRIGRSRQQLSCRAAAYDPGVLKRCNPNRVRGEYGERRAQNKREIKIGNTKTTGKDIRKFVSMKQ